MKRVIFSLTGTVVGIVALLSFKTESQVAAPSGGLPSAALPGSTATASTATPTKTAAPPDPSPSPSSTSPASTATAGNPATVSYTGTAERTRYGVVQVKITVSGKKVTNVGFAQLTAFDGRSQQINSGAAPVLLQESLTAQSARINSVSGASYTSQGYIQSLQSALDKAGI